MGLHETTITELLNSFFNEEPKYIRKAVVDFLFSKTNEFKFEDFNKFSDQGKFENKENNKLPDLVFEGPDSLVFIEVKINNAELQPSQSSKNEKDPNCYIGMLKKDKHKNKGLYFLVPSDYSHKESIPVEESHIITWKQLDEFVKHNQYDNQILNRIIQLTSDYNFTYEKINASDLDMYHLIYDIDYLPRMERIHNRLRSILDGSNCESAYFKKGDTITDYRWDPGDTGDNHNCYKNKACIAEGKENKAKNDAFALCIIPGLPYIYLDTMRELVGKENLQPELKNGTYLYQVCELDISIEKAIGFLNNLLVN